jgi:hypothetical protein
MFAFFNLGLQELLILGVLASLLVVVPVVVLLVYYVGRSK